MDVLCFEVLPRGYMPDSISEPDMTIPRNITHKHKSMYLLLFLTYENILCLLKTEYIDGILYQRLHC